VAVRVQAGLASGEVAVCANAEAESAIPIATEAEKIIRDIVSSKNSLPQKHEADLSVGDRTLKPAARFELSVF